MQKLLVEGGLGGVSPRIEDKLGIGVVADSSLKFPLNEEHPQGIGLRLGDGALPPIDLAPSVGAGALVVKAPHIGVVAVGVDPKAPVTIVSAILPPPSEGMDGVFQTIGIQHGYDPHFAVVHHALYLRVDIILLNQVLGNVIGDLHREPLPCMVASHQKHLRLHLIKFDIVADFNG